MANASYLFELTNEPYPINKNYYLPAVQYTISMPIILVPNLYFLYITLTDKVFTKRPVLKTTILTFCFLNIATISFNLMVSSYYLNSYFNGGLIRPSICSYMRRMQMLMMILLVTTPLLFTVHRYFTVFSNGNYQNYISLIICIVANFPALILFISMFLTTDIIWVADEICGYIKNPIVPFYVNTLESIYYVSLAIPLIVLVINFIMIKRLSSLSVTSSVGKHKKNENRIVFINLLIQTLQPFIGQWPSILFYFYLVITKNNIYIVWRILDGLTALSLVLNIIFSIIFIKDVRNVFLKKIGMNVVNIVGDAITITNHTVHKVKSTIII
uniref:G_PROTEIN_RECEP_F1_2 domain-containing protein n=1 Tax=Parastrongyloides trichosuri TaxID=131310 RepID=A0A0N4ZCM0_PARTI